MQNSSFVRNKPPLKRHRPFHHEQGWLSWIIANRFVMIIILIVLLLLIGPWLFCDVLGFNSICSIVSGIFSLIAKIFRLVGL